MVTKERHSNRGRYSMLNEVLEYISAFQGVATAGMVAKKFGLKPVVASSLMSYYKRIGYVEEGTKLYTGGRPKNTFSLTQKGLDRLSRHQG